MGLKVFSEAIKCLVLVVFLMFNCHVMGQTTPTTAAPTTAPPTTTVKPLLLLKPLLVLNDPKLEPAVSTFTDITSNEHGYSKLTKYEGPQDIKFDYGNFTREATTEINSNMLDYSINWVQGTDELLNITITGLITCISTSKTYWKIEDDVIIYQFNDVCLTNPVPGDAFKLQISIFKTGDIRFTFNKPLEPTSSRPLTLALKAIPRYLGGAGDTLTGTSKSHTVGPISEVIYAGLPAPDSSAKHIKPISVVVSMVAAMAVLVFSGFY